MDKEDRQAKIKALLEQIKGAKEERSYGDTLDRRAVEDERYAKRESREDARFTRETEKIEQDKNHVMTDFILSALNNNKIDVKTDGQESRQFIYVDDASYALTKIMESYNTTKELRWKKISKLYGSLHI